jgi:hypothetical protein
LNFKSISSFFLYFIIKNFKLPIEISFWVILSFLRCPFADPSLTLRRPFAEAQGFGSGLCSGKRLLFFSFILSFFFVILTLSRSEEEESTLFFRDFSGY